MKPSLTSISNCRCLHAVCVTASITLMFVLKFLSFLYLCFRESTRMQLSGLMSGLALSRPWEEIAFLLLMPSGI